MVESRIPEREVWIRSLHTPYCVLEQDNFTPGNIGNTPEAVAPFRHDLKCLLGTLNLNTNTQKQQFSEIQVMHRKLQIADIHSCTPAWIGLVGLSVSRLLKL